MGSVRVRVRREGLQREVRRPSAAIPDIAPRRVASQKTADERMLLVG